MDAIKGDTPLADTMCDAPHGLKLFRVEVACWRCQLKNNTLPGNSMIDEIRDQTEVLVVDAPAGASTV